MKLSEVLKSIDYKSENFTDADLTDIAYDSRKAGESIAFVCLKGAFADGHKYALSAYEKGSRVFVCSDSVSLPGDAVVITVSDTRAALAQMSCNFFKNPSKDIAVIGITGTKGKTTVAHIVKNVLEKGGIMTGIIGTVGASFGDTVLPTVNTTPESYELQKMLRQMADGGCKAAAIEVSSLGLKAHRVDGITFAVGVFTNLSPDHIGTNEHESFEEYAYWKTQLFPRCKVSIINADDPFAPVIKENCNGKVYTYGTKESCDFALTKCDKIKFGNVLGMSFTFKNEGEEKSFNISLPGDVNASNALVAAAAAKIFRIDDGSLKKGLETVFVKGRGEMLQGTEDFTVIIDYAHNGLSLKSIIDTTKAYEHNRVVTLFGSVGGRTECRRQELGSVAGALSDFSIITSDDPNFEDPLKICEEIAQSCKKQGGDYIIIPDRAKAIEYAVLNAQKGDIIILAGKGHENTMKVNGENLPFNEKDEFYKAMKKRNSLYAEKINHQGKYLFVYFVGNGEGEETLHFAVSENGYDFKPLNNNKPVITQTKGKKCVRDPYIFRGEKGEAYIIGTDMKCEEGWESNHALITWKSTDLINWTDETLIDIKDLGEKYKNTTRAWAPQAIWDEKENAYMIYWAHSTKEHNTAGMYYAHSADMKTITEPKPLYIREGIQTIDGDIIYSEKENLFFLFFKHDEDQTIAYVTSKSLTGPYEDKPTVVSLAPSGVEGSQIYRLTGTDTYLLVMDEYGKGRFFMQQTDNLRDYKAVKRSDYEMDFSPRHGSIMAISDEEYRALVSHLWSEDA